MSLIDPQQTTVDLSKSVPGGWQLIGFSELRSDGVNPFRVPQPVTEIRFSTPGPRYVQFNYQLFSPKADVQAKVTLDGQPLGRFTFPAGQFVTVNPAGFVKAGPHVLRFEQGCSQTCPVSQYHAGANLMSAPPAQQDIGLGAKRWYLNAPPSGFTVSGFSSPAFDGVNFFRTMNDKHAAVLTLPPSNQTSILRYQTISDSGDYHIEWHLPDGQQVPVQTTRGPSNASLPTTGIDSSGPLKGQFVDQNLLFLNRSGVKQISVEVKCQGGGTDCLPVRFYHIELTSLNIPSGFRGLTTGEQVGAGLGLLGALALFALLLRPARARR